MHAPTSSPASGRTIVAAFAGLVLVGSMSAGLGLAQQKAATAMATSAGAFLASLSPEQRQKAVFPIDSDEWTRWHFIPVVQFPRHGLTIKEMSDLQRQKAHDLLKVSLSQAGYKTATSIMSLETTLGALEDKERAAAATSGGRGPAVIPRDPENYFWSVFGDPSAKGKWGWRLEGHHVSLHFSVDGGKLSVSSTPLFFGSNPAEVREGPQKGLRILAVQEDTARALVGALTETERTAAIVAPVAPGDIISMTKVQADPLNPTGLVASQMTAAHRDLLMKIIEAYSSAMLPEVAADRMAKARAAGLDKVAFAWFGPLQKGEKYYYRIQGPTFLIEHNNTQNNGNHIHSVWRDFNGDFGRDVLAEHMALYPH
jgi:hypothetical protein